MLLSLGRSSQLLCLALLAFSPSLVTSSTENVHAATALSETSSVRGLVGDVLSRVGIFKRATTSIPGTTAGTDIQPQHQNGVSLWGMFALLHLPSFRTDGGTQVNNGWPWGRINTVNTNPYTGGPYTAVVRKYNFNLAECDFAPDGVTTTKVLCINGQFPGPLIEANYGDNISVTVTNSLTDQGTSMHWHGFLQTMNMGMDGVPGVQQCPIAPGSSFTYTFRAELYGSSWYHTHYSAQYAVGAVGPIVVYGPSQLNYDIDLGPVMLNEWYRNNFAYYVQRYMTPLSQGGPTLPLASSNLINGKMRFPCSKTTSPCVTADYAKFNFTSGRTHRLRLMNTGASAIQKFAIDNHVMQVIATDFMPVVPYNTSMIALGVGQRADVIVYGSGKPTDVLWMRSNDVACSLNDGNLTEALGIIYYEKSDHVSLPSAGTNQGPAASISLMSCANDPLTSTVPAYPLAIDPNFDPYTLNISLKSNGTNLLFYMGNVSAKVSYNNPTIGHVVSNDPNGQLSANHYILDSNKTSVRVILYNYDDSAHPIHLHGHNAQILNVGMGKWDGSIVRPNNPTRRDVFVMPPGSTTTPSYLVLQWPQNNPGVWPLHCHFAWHSSMGLVANFVEGWRYLNLYGRFALVGIDLCPSWNAWMKKAGPLLTGIDSGIKARGLDAGYNVDEEPPYDEYGRIVAREIFPGSGVPSYGNNTKTPTERYLNAVKAGKVDEYLAETAQKAGPPPPIRPTGPVHNEEGHEIFR